MGLIVLGTVALDNVKTPSGVKKDMLGGSAAHFAMSARILTDVAVAAVVGKDFPKKHVEFFQRKGINTKALTVCPGKTFSWTGEYKNGDLNTALTHATELGVLASGTLLVPDALRASPCVFLANYDPDLQAQFLSSMLKPKFVGLDSMNLWINTKIKSLRKLMKQVQLFVANDAEARAITQTNNLIKAAQALRQMGPSIVVIKKGEHGVLVVGKGFMFGYPAYPVDRVVDPTGAGDTFAGALMGAIARAGKTDEKALRRAALLATAAASFNVEGFGMARTAPLNLKDLEGRVKALSEFVSVA